MPPKPEENAKPEVAAEAAPAAATEAPAAPATEAAPAPAPAPQAPPLTAYLDHDDKEASANVAGVPIVRGDNGLFLAPLSVVEHLLPHGFRVVSEGK